MNKRTSEKSEKTSNEKDVNEKFVFDVRRILILINILLNGMMTMRNINKKYFSVLPKAPKMELTMRSPYKTFFKNFIGFQRIYVGTQKGQMAISNRTPPVIYLLPAGEIRVTNMQRTVGNLTDSNSNGEFVHSGGYVIVHE
jgi:hypothetical protein